MESATGMNGMWICSIEEVVSCLKRLWRRAQFHCLVSGTISSETNCWFGSKVMGVGVKNGIEGIHGSCQMFTEEPDPMR